MPAGPSFPDRQLNRLQELAGRAGRRAYPRAAVWAQRAAERAGLAPAPGADGPATEADVVAAYRLLLGREPDPEGLAMYRQRLGRGELSRDRLAGELLGSPEFARRHPALVAPGVATEEVEVEGFAITVDPTDWAVGATIAAVHRYEPDVTAVVRSLIGPGGTFIDVGANIGWFALLTGSIVGPTGRVLAIEPNLRNCELLATSAARNDFDQVEVVAGAASDAPAWLALETDASNGRVIPLGEVTGTTQAVRCSYAVPAFTLDQLLADRGITVVDAMKVDVEGVEAAVFTGAEGLLTGQHPPIVFEWFPEALRSTGGVDPTAPLRLLREHGYGVSVIGHPSAAEADGALTDNEIEAVRASAGRQNLDLLARALL